MDPCMELDGMYGVLPIAEATIETGGKHSAFMGKIFCIEVALGVAPNGEHKPPFWRQ